MTDRARRSAAIALLAFGAFGVVVGGGAFLQAGYNAWLFDRSGEADRMQRQVAELQGGASGGRAERGTPLPSTGGGQSAIGGPSEGLTSADPSAPGGDGEPPPRRAAASQIELTGVQFTFDDPPQAGAHARLAIDLQSHADLASDPISLAISSRWFDGYRLVDATPMLVDDRPAPDGFRHLDFSGLDPGASASFELRLTATDDDVSAPEVWIGLKSGGEIAQAHPMRAGPPPKPGPPRAISIPSIGIQSAVVPTSWEPPNFVVGQLRNSANLTEGNTVLIGHLTGLAGNIFAQIDRLQPGAEVITISRGLEYRFVVSQMLVLPNDDQTPLDKTDTPRLTLMTCTGIWNPLTQDYSERIWVMAEPPEAATATITRNAEQAAAEATATAQAANATPTPEPSPEPGPRQRPRATALPGPIGPVASAAQPRPPAVSHRGDLPSPPYPGQLPAVGLEIKSPTDNTRVPSRFTVEGSRNLPIDLSLHLWLFVRAEVDGARWYADPRPIEPRPDGTWQADLDLGGPPNVKHELRLGALDTKTQTSLIRFIAEHPNEPLDDLPKVFSNEVGIVVVRE